MKTFVAILLSCMAALQASAQNLPGTTTPVRSASGQFTVFAAQPPSAPAPPPARSQTNLVHLDASLVAVSAERIRQAVWNELGYAGAWNGRVVISLRDTRGMEEAPEIECSRAPGGWNYRVFMAEWIPSELYMRTLVQVVLMELANRTAKDEIAEIPTWLTEGLTAHLLANKRVELIIERPQISMNGVTFSPPVVQDRRRISQLEKAHKILLGETPLTFEELSWPAPAQIAGPEGAQFRACAQLLTHELLTLRGGRECMRDFLAKLPAHLNWQMAFLAGLAHQKATDPKLGELLAVVEASPPATDSPESANVREWRRSYDRATKLPAELVEEIARVTTQAQQAWEDAKKANHFPMYRPWLEKVVALKRQEAAAVGFTDHPYDALLSE